MRIDFTRFWLSGCVLLLGETIILLHAKLVRFYMDEELPVGSHVGSLQTFVPRDSSQVHFIKLETKSENDVAVLFTVSETSGEVAVAGRLDRETLCSRNKNRDNQLLGSLNVMRSINSWPLELLSYDSRDCELRFRVNCLTNTVSHSSQVVEKLIAMFDIIIVLIDINDNGCEFLPSNLQTIQLQEDAVPRKTVVRLNPVYDPDHSRPHQQKQPYIVYLRELQSYEVDSIDLRSHNSTQISQKGNKPIRNMFKIKIGDRGSSLNQSWTLLTLELELLGPLDFEKQSRYDLLVIATDNNQKLPSDQRRCRLNLTVEVLDCNDNSPVFSQHVYTVNQSEGGLIGSLVVQVHATDVDQGSHGSVRYAFLNSVLNVEESNRFGPFRLDPETGELRLQQQLNVREQASYTLRIIAYNPRTNQLTAHEITPTLRLEAEVGDEKAIALVNIFVQDINDHAPEIRMFSPTGSSHIEAKEESLPGQDVAVIEAYDEDVGVNAEVTCQLSNRSIMETFQLSPMDTDHDQKDNPTIRRYKLTLKVTLDREVNPTGIPLMVHCRDNGQPSLTNEVKIVLHLTDINDNNPTFEKPAHFIAVMEDSDPLRAENGYQLLTLHASDKDEGVNSNLTYQIASISDESLLRLVRADSESGQLFSTGLLDREGLANFSITVIATDHGKSPLSGQTVVNIQLMDYNDNAPTFSEKAYKFTLRENTPRGHLIGTFQVTDLDVGRNALVNVKIDQVYRSRFVNFQSRSSLFPLSKSKLSPPTSSQPYSDTSTVNPIPKIRMMVYPIPQPLSGHRNLSVYECQMYTTTVWDREALLPSLSDSAQQKRHFFNGREELDFTGEEKWYREVKAYTNVTRSDVYVVVTVTARDEGSPRLMSSAVVQVKIEDENDNAPVFLNPDPSSPNLTRVSVSYRETAGFAFMHVSSPEATTPFLCASKVWLDFSW